MRTDRLLYLAREVLPNVPPEQFSMDTWSCGTVACAFGHMCLSQRGKDDGLVLVRDGDTYRPEYGTDEFCIGYLAAEAYFEISNDDAEWLFSPDGYYDPTPQDVINRIEDLVASEGDKP